MEPTTSRPRRKFPAPGRFFKTRTIGAIVAGILVLASGGSFVAMAQTYPAAPVKLIVTTGAGGAPDVIARIVAEGLSRRWGQQVVVAGTSCRSASSANNRW